MVKLIKKTQTSKKITMKIESLIYDFHGKRLHVL